jgi:hypothetical protein
MPHSGFLQADVSSLSRVELGLSSRDNLDDVFINGFLLV